MKTYPLLFALLILGLSSACGNDDDGMTVDDRAKFLGTYQVSDVCSFSGADSYSITISNGSSMNQIQISNFWDEFIANVTATVSGNNLTIAEQDPDNDGVLVSGSGTISGNTITWSFVIESAGLPDDNCSGTATK